VNYVFFQSKSEMAEMNVQTIAYLVEYVHTMLCEGVKSKMIAKALDISNFQ
jgi:hypothetical protein